MLSLSFLSHQMLLISKTYDLFICLAGENFPIWIDMLKFCSEKNILHKFSDPFQ